MESLTVESYLKDSCARARLEMRAFWEDERENEAEDSEELELNLGLSLGGQFGVDKALKEKNKLVRSSSIIGTLPFVRRGGVGGSSRDDAASPIPPMAYPELVRTSSLLTEMEEQWRKRKEMQTLRQTVTKRRRSEKQRSYKNLDSMNKFGSEFWPLENL